MKLFLILMSIFFVSFWASPNYSLTISPSLGSWHNTYLEGSRQKVINNKLSIILRDNEYLIDKYSELLLHFNKDGEKDDYLRNYKVQNKNFLLSMNNKVFGASAAKFAYKSSLVLIPKRNSLFNKTAYIGSFTIEFWANPALLSDDEIVFKRYGPVIANGKVDKYSGIVCSIKDKKLKWAFHNVFHTPNFSNKTIAIPLININGKYPLRTSKWTHHAITFNNLNGKLTYYVNGNEETSIFVTTSRQAQDTILTLKFYKQEKLPLVIGENFYGHIDEFAISRTDKLPKKKILLANTKKENKYSYFNITPYIQSKAFVTSGVYNLEQKNSWLEKVRIDKNEKNMSYIRLQYRMSNSFFIASEDDKYLPWQDINDNTEMENIKGLYFQWRAILNSGENGKYSPSLQDISFSFKRDMPPRPPSYLVAVSKDKQVFLNWTANLEKDVIGYKIYYGLEKGNYLASKEPITLPLSKIKNKLNIEYVIPNLEVNRIYYFTITAIDKNENESMPAREVSVIVTR